MDLLLLVGVGEEVLFFVAAKVEEWSALSALAAWRSVSGCAGRPGERCLWLVMGCTPSLEA